MLYREEGKWKLAPFKVIYKQHGQTLEQYTHNKKWWEDFAAKWDHTEIIEFVELNHSAEQLARLEEVQEVEEGFEYYAGRYVIDGVFPDELDEEERMLHHPLKTIQLAKENKELGQLATDLDIRLLMQELK